MRPIDADALPTLATELRLKNGKTKHFVGVELDDIKNAPTIDPLRHGEWKETDDPIFRACSVCGYLEYECNEGNYCPECGAKMDGGKDHETNAKSGIVTAVITSGRKGASR